MSFFKEYLVPLVPRYHITSNNKDISIEFSIYLITGE